VQAQVSRGKGCLLVGMIAYGLAGVLAGKVLTPSPKGEGWGEVALCFELESKHADQEYCHRTTSHKSKTGMRKRVTARNDTC